MSKGYLIYAVDEPYIGKAQTLKKSIEHHTNDDVTIISDNFPYKKTEPLVWDGKVQPTFTNDVCLAIYNCLKNDKTIGQSYDLGGPHIYEWSELYE